MSATNTAITASAPVNTTETPTTETQALELPVNFADLSKKDKALAVANNAPAKLPTKKDWCATYMAANPTAKKSEAVRKYDEALADYRKTLAVFAEAAKQVFGAHLITAVTVMKSGTGVNVSYRAPVETKAPKSDDKDDEIAKLKAELAALKAAK